MEDYKDLYEYCWTTRTAQATFSSTHTVFPCHLNASYNLTVILSCKKLILENCKNHYFFCGLSISCIFRAVSHNLWLEIGHVSHSCNGPTYLPFILNGRNILLLTEYPCVLDYMFVSYLEKETCWE